TEAIYNVLFKRMDGSTQNALLVMENERKATRISRQRILPNIEHARRLAAQMSENPDDTTKYSVIMRNGFCLNIGWSGSQAAVASDPCETVLLDEVDKYEVSMNIEEAKDRITTFNETGLVVINSTPGEEGGPIEVEMETCDTVCDYHVECPHCGAVQMMNFDNFWWPDREKDLKDSEARRKFANKVRRERLAGYACAGCGVVWDDFDRDRAVKLGLGHHFHGWKMREPLDNAVSVGFQVPSWISPFKSLSHIAARWIMANQPGQPGKLRAWYNQEAAEAYIEGEELIDPDALYDRREDFGGVIPAPVCFLTAAADTQRDRMEVDIKGWAPGEQSWSIAHIIINGAIIEEKVQDALDDVLFKQYRHESGEQMTIKRTCIDSAGDYPSAVYAYCKDREHRGVYAIKGSSDPRADILDGKMVRRKDAVFQKVGGVACKDILFNRLALREEGPGYMHFSMEYDREYFHQFRAERPGESKGGRRIYKQKPGRKNEAIDLNVYNIAALRLYDPDWDALRREGVATDEGTRLAFRHHDTERHIDGSITLKIERPIIVCADFGKNPLVWVLAQSDGRKVWCFDEVTRRNATTTDMAMEILRRYGSHKRGFTIYGSAAGTARTAGKTEYAILKDLGFTRAIFRKTNAPLVDRVNAVNNMLEDVSGASRLTYHPDCVNLGRDFTRAIWLDDMSDIDRTDFGRGMAADALGFYINHEWPLRLHKPDPKRRFWK
ncbi:MAG: terminase gpA endonuclease subunit, partial [Dehalococcoidia bacterium]